MNPRKTFKGPFGWTLQTSLILDSKEIWIASGNSTGGINSHLGPSLPAKEVDKLIKWLVKQRKKMDE